VREKKNRDENNSLSHTPKTKRAKKKEPNETAVDTRFLRLIVFCGFHSLPSLLLSVSLSPAPELLRAVPNHTSSGCDVRTSSFQSARDVLCLEWLWLWFIPTVNNLYPSLHTHREPPHTARKLIIFVIFSAFSVRASPHCTDTTPHPHSSHFFCPRHTAHATHTRYMYAR